MTNEEKILEMLTKMQADIDALKKKLNVQDDETPEEKNYANLRLSEIL